MCVRSHTNQNLHIKNACKSTGRRGARVGDGACGDWPKVMRVKRAVHGDGQRFPVPGLRLEQVCVEAVLDGVKPVGVVAGLGGQIEGDGEPGLPLGEIPSWYVSVIPSIPPLGANANRRRPAKVSSAGS